MVNACVTSVLLWFHGASTYTDQLTSAAESDFHCYQWATVWNTFTLWQQPPNSLKFFSSHSSICSRYWFLWDADSLELATSRKICQIRTVPTCPGPNIQLLSLKCIGTVIRLSRLVSVSLSLLSFRVSLPASYQDILSPLLSGSRADPLWLTNKTQIFPKQRILFRISTF